MEYNIYGDDTDDDERPRRLVVLTPLQRQLSVAVSRIVEASTEALHSSARAFLNRAGVFSDLRTVELEGLRGRYSTVDDVLRALETLFQRWTQNYQSEDLDNVLPSFWVRLRTLTGSISLTSNCASDHEAAPLLDYFSSAGSATQRRIASGKRSDLAVPLPDRPSLPDLSSVMRPDYPIGDAFDYQDSQPLIPNLKQPRPSLSFSDGAQLSLDHDMLSNAGKSCAVSAQDEGRSVRTSDCMPENVARLMMLKAIAAEILSAGYSSVHSKVLDIIVDVTIDNLRQWAKRLKESNLDVCLLLSDDGLRKQLLRYWRDRKDSPPEFQFSSATSSNSSTNADAKKPRLH